MKEHSTPIKNTDVESIADEQIDAVEDVVTLDKSNLHLQLGEITYNILVDLKTLQGKKEPYFNATEIIKQYNDTHGTKKRIVDWTRSKRFKEIINIYGCDFNTRESMLYRREKVKGNQYNIFIHKELFLSLMIWLDAKHEIAITSFVGNVVEKIDATKLIRKELITPTKQLNTLLVMVGNMLKEELPDSSSGDRIIDHVQKAINNTTVGIYGKVDRNTLTLHQNEQMDYLEREIGNKTIMLLQLGYTGGEIKEYILGLLRQLKEVAV